VTFGPQFFNQRITAENYKKFNEIIEGLSVLDDEECRHIKRELVKLSELYRKKEARLEKIVDLSDKQQRAILKLNEELDDYRRNLERKVAEEIEKRELQEKRMIEQSKKVALVEMIDAVAHQWVQPLNILSMKIEALNRCVEKNPAECPQTVRNFRQEAL
jgi:phosphoglycerate-specific signal transduction histidine kinase